jgi:hypothetical protein
MKEDSTYKAPGRIPEDTLINFLNRGEFGRMQTERDQFLNDDDFQAAMYRHFPSGPN